ncbi:hypothetical protein BCR44DRAFT_331336 [Catenaria anguillulae PL171]|uniref:C2H2-type domain-containing protein n=1 Tax=Catenaria anguillulae PL171 TaxID=765915 RepID=A0A1Y2HKY1_9FUNG|nr:hypothetical protein BCR44DRAFT_331336 [Catenaria anguillulae PL171]
MSAPSPQRPTIPDVLRQLAPLLNSLPPSHASPFSIFSSLPPSALPSPSTIPATSSTPTRTSTTSTVQQHPQSSPSRPASASSASTPSSPSSSSQAIIVRTPTGAWYCSACKKSFASQATCTAHEQSGKHKDAVKKLGKVAGGAGSATGGPKPNRSSTRNTAGSESQSVGFAAAGPTQAPTSAELGDVLAKLKKVKSIEPTNPLLAVTVYWNISQALWTQFTDPRDTALGLSLLLAHMHRAADAIASADPGALPSPHAHLLAQVTLALARLLTVTLASVPSRDRAAMEKIVGMLAVAVAPAPASKTDTGSQHMDDDMVPADMVARVQQAPNLDWCNSESIGELAAWIGAWADSHVDEANVRVAGWVVASTDQARNQCAMDLIDYHVVRGAHVQTFRWARYLIPQLTPGISRELVAVEAAIAALLVKDRVGMRVIVQELAPDLAQAVELKFAAHLLDRNVAQSTWAMQAAQLTHRVQRAIVVAKQLPKASPSPTHADSLCVRLVEGGIWGFARVARWESVVLACVNDERICGME